jgi:two-component system, OmpR family, sensor histidine kinase BaeS
LRRFSASATGSAFPGMTEFREGRDPRAPFSSHRSTPTSAARRDGGLSSPIARRLALLIALVALVALGLLATATLVFANNDVTNLSRQQRIDLGDAVASAVLVSYNRVDSWKGVELSPALTLASHAGVAVQVRNASGALVDSANPQGVRPSTLGPALVVPVISDGVRVGSVSVRTSTAGIGAADSSLRRALATGIGWSALVLAVLAVMAGVVFARRITRPVVALTGAARAMASGARGARVADVQAPGELADLSRAFNQMADTLEREDQLRRVLVADVAHELRTPLAILQATTEAMADGITEPTAVTLSSLHDETLRLGRIVADLEVLASAEAAGLALALKPVDLALVAAEAAEALKPQLESAGLSLTRDLQAAVVRGDKNRLHQVLTNLLTNAIKFTPAGGSVRLSVGSQGRLVTMVVEDTGRGIPPDDMVHVFDRFWRGPAVQQTEGSGVGLAVVQELVSAHNGHVNVASEEGHGARFVVTFQSA